MLRVRRHPSRGHRWTREQRWRDQAAGAVGAEPVPRAQSTCRLHVHAWPLHDCPQPECHRYSTATWTLQHRDASVTWKLHRRGTIVNNRNTTVTAPLPGRTQLVRISPGPFHDPLSKIRCTRCKRSTVMLSVPAGRLLMYSQASSYLRTYSHKHIQYITHTI